MILISGASGTVGNELVNALLADSVPFRALSRQPEKLSHLKGKAEVAKGDLSDLESLKAAMKGCDHAFLLTTDQGVDSDLKFIEAAKSNGVRHVVKLSTSFVDRKPESLIGRWHGEKEKLLKDSGLAWTMLRPGGFSSNALQWLQTIKASGKVFYATGEHANSVIDPLDIAAVAKVALTQPGHEGQVYELHNDELLSPAQQVSILSKVLGRPIDAVPISVEQAAEAVRKFRPEFVEAMVDMVTQIRDGVLTSQPNGVVEKVTGKKPQTFESWCQRHKAAFN